MGDGTKIARFPAEEPQENNAVTEQVILDLIQKQKDSGNIDKAYQLAQRLAAEAGANDEEYLLDDRLPNEIYHRRMLLIFSVISSIEAFCPNEFIASIAKSRFYEVIRAMPGEIYDDENGDAVFSSYYLCLRDAQDPDYCIGQTFAAFCESENDKLCCELGENLYRFFVKLVEGCVVELQFTAD